MNDEKAFLRTFPFVLIVALFASIILYFVSGGFDWVYSYVLGVMTSLLAMSMHYKRIMKVTFTEPHKIRQATTFIYIFKFVMYSLILGYAIFDQKNGGSMRWIAVLLGIETFRIVLFANIIITKRVGEQND